MNSCLKKDRPLQDYSTDSAANAQVNAGPSRVEELKIPQCPPKQLEMTARGKPAHHSPSPAGTRRCLDWWNSHQRMCRWHGTLKELDSPDR